MHLIFLCFLNSNDLETLYKALRCSRGSCVQKTGCTADLAGSDTPSLAYPIMHLFRKQFSESEV